MFSYAFPGHGSREMNTFSDRNWFSGDYVSCNVYFDFHDWDLTFYGLDCIKAYDELVPIVNRAIQSYIPPKRQNRGRPPWQRSIPSELSNNVKNAWKSYKFLRSRNPRNSVIVKDAHAAFRTANLALKNATIKAVSDYEYSLASDKKNPKRFHSYLRSKKVDRPSVGPLLVDGNWIGENESMGHTLGTAFSSVFNPVLPCAPLPHQTCATTLEFSPVLPSQVHSALLGLNNSTSCGPDGIPSIFLKKCASSLAYPLSIIYNKSFSTGLVPTPWKSAIILPLFKGGIRSDPLKYRPISLTPPACKTAERLALPQLNSHLDTNNILSDLQFGFRPGVSVSDQLLYTYNYIVSHYDKGDVVDIMYFDYEKAFDRVNHALLLEKLSCIGIGPPLIRWFRNFLVGRDMRIAVHGTLSDSFNVLSGVPQGTVLAPTLFSIFINFVTDGLDAKFCLFADDLKLYVAVSSNDAPSTLLQSSINILNDRSSSWGLNFSQTKCRVMRFARKKFDNLPPPVYYLNGAQVEVVSKHRDLGITVDSSLKFHDHITDIVRKAYGVAHGYLRATVNRTPLFMKEIFLTHIRPLLDFSSVVWNTGYLEDLYKLESVLRFWTRNVYGFDNLSYETRLRRLDIFSMTGRLMRADLIQLWKIVHGKAPRLSHIIEFSQVTRTRGHAYKLNLPRHETDIFARSFPSRCIRRWNSLSDSIVSAESLDKFKALLMIEMRDALLTPSTRD